MGPYIDEYRVTHDAQLSFREFVSVISYLSSYLKNQEI